MNLRLFVAIEPPDLVRRRLAALQTELKRASGAADVRWVAVENVHLTLQFLGAVPEERVPAVKEAVAAAAERTRPLHLELHGTGGFPSARRARVVWAGVAGDVAPLAELVAELGRRLAPLGFTPEERAFSPHLTLGRARDPRGAAGLAAALAQAASAPPAPWRASEIVLFQSHLSPKGPRYEALARTPFGGAAV
ncbi:MAG TPA: RNA 2',3'-cyclic phosphodiesterase [Anaeromyxobacteraceae bacterium]